MNTELAHKINANGDINVAKACKAVNAKMIFISSEQVFNGNVEGGPYDEEKYVDNPRNVRLNTDKIIKASLEFTTTEEGIKQCVREYKLNF